MLFWTLKLALRAVPGGAGEALGALEAREPRARPGARAAARAYHPFD